MNSAAEPVWPVEATMGLTDREVRFAAARARGLTVRQAASVAGYQSSRPDGLRQIGQEADGKPHIRAAVQALRITIIEEKELPHGQLIIG